MNPNTDDAERQYLERRKAIVDRIDAASERIDKFLVECIEHINQARAIGAAQGGQ